MFPAEEAISTATGQVRDVESTTGARSAFERELEALLDQVARGQLTSQDAAARLRNLPFSDLGFAKVDHHRELRQGACEIVLAEGKTVEQVASIVERLIAGNAGPVLVTRADEARAEAVRRVSARFELPVRESRLARALAIVRNVPDAAGRVAIVSAGTADLPVAEEAALTASLHGAEVDVIADVGVAGLHRLLAVRERIEAADVIVVVAGMDAALASVVGGLAPSPVIACPTSVGYGANFSGLSALLAMLSSCAPGVVCVGIDDGVGAGFSAASIARRTRRPEESA